MGKKATPKDKKLWDCVKEKWRRSDSGGDPGQWTARKAQLAVKEYKDLGGTYEYQSPEERQKNSLSIWTNEEWDYINGNSDGRYLPKKVRAKLTESEKLKENKLKSKGNNIGKKKVSYSDSVLEKFRSSCVGKLRCMEAIPNRHKDGTLIFEDYPEFRPNLTPVEIFSEGAFGGTYWRPIKSGVTGEIYSDVHKNFPMFKDIPGKLMTCKHCNVSKNKYGVASGTSLEYWESKGWIVEQDPYGWVQWYTNFYMGRRSADDKRQIKRWLAFTGPKGRFKTRLVNMIKKEKTSYDDVHISPVIRQGLHQWAYCITPKDIE